MPDTFVNAVYRWNADYAVGVPQIDQEHQGLFELAGSQLNVCGRTLAAGVSKKVTVL
jgi:hemerythrin